MHTIFVPTSLLGNSLPSFQNTQQGFGWLIITNTARGAWGQIFPTQLWTLGGFKLKNKKTTKKNQTKQKHHKQANKNQKNPIETKKNPQKNPTLAIYCYSEYTYIFLSFICLILLYWSASRNMQFFLNCFVHSLERIQKSQAGFSITRQYRFPLPVHQVVILSLYFHLAGWLVQWCLLPGKAHGLEQLLDVPFAPALAHANSLGLVYDFLIDSSASLSAELPAGKGGKEKRSLEKHVQGSHISFKF